MRIVSIYHVISSHRLIAVELALGLLRHVLGAIFRRSSKDFCILVEARLALCVLVASGQSLFAVYAAGGVGVLACCFGVGCVGFAAAHEVVDEGVGVLACALGGFLWMLLALLLIEGCGWWDAYAALVHGAFHLVGCAFS